MPASPPRAVPAADADDLSRRLLTALVCAAVEPKLSGVLLFDLPDAHLSTVAEVLEGLLAGPAGPHVAAVPRTTLTAATMDEDLWLRPRMSRGPLGIDFALAPGPLTEPVGPSTVVVPDLARLSVPGKRAAVQLLGADVATVEHAGLQRRWRPAARWLAVCRTEDTERISPHLLDRFPIRLTVQGLRPRPGDAPLGPLPDTWATALDRARSTTRPPLHLDEGFAPRVLELLDDQDGAGQRRPLALARIARALARLDGAGRITADHVDAAARLIGLRSARRPPAPPATGPAETTWGAPRILPPPEPRPDAERRPSPGTPVLEPGPAEHIGSGPAAGPWPTAGTPYPEDTAGPPLEGTSLRTPARHTAGSRAARGPVVGVRPAQDLWDLALVRTAMEAAKYRAIRERRDRLVILPRDLRGYVRAPEPVRMLTLVLDHTCREDWDWHEALDPFLQWAYVTRASVHVVEVGGRGAPNEVRAEAFAALSTRSPRIAAALDRPAGRATPLAHGLNLAEQTLRRAFQHHRAGLVEALLVLVTDGRGNVPLAVSHRGRADRGAVGRTGIEDALAAAVRISGMDRTRLHSVVVDPGRQPYAELPQMLAEALDGRVVEGRPVREAAARGQ
ncbi:hypothetical protein OG609_13090 [Streptomyces sp. NBC_01224]|uniref:hypothetical protein n=1 Tax=unclassified Streptomyces TaxID=2593676 RepID=UPI002E116F58|nr:hypothetical protein OG609_13090 [Streptomyces sp. NBC_01224]